MARSMKVFPQFKEAVTVLTEKFWTKEKEKGDFSKKAKDIGAFIDKGKFGCRTPMVHHLTELLIEEDIPLARSESGYVPRIPQGVLLIVKTNPNGHSYPYEAGSERGVFLKDGKPELVPIAVIKTSDYQAIRVTGTEGNNLPSSRDDFRRPTEKEALYFWTVFESMMRKNRFKCSADVEGIIADAGLKTEAPEAAEATETDTDE